MPNDELGMCRKVSPDQARAALANAQLRRRWHRAPLLAVLASCSLSVPVAAQVHKCISPHGKLEFSDQPCPAGSKGERLHVQPNSIDSSGMREQALKFENRRLREQLAGQEATERARTSASQSGRTYADLQAEKENSPVCLAAKKDYATAMSSQTDRDKGNDRRADRLAMYAAYGMHEPDESKVIVATSARRTVETIVSCTAGGCMGSRGTYFPRMSCNGGACVGGVPTR